MPPPCYRSLPFICIEINWEATESNSGASRSLQNAPARLNLEGRKQPLPRRLRVCGLNIEVRPAWARRPRVDFIAAGYRSWTYFQRRLVSSHRIRKWMWSAAPDHPCLQRLSPFESEPRIHVLWKEKTMLWTVGLSMFLGCNLLCRVYVMCAKSSFTDYSAAIYGLYEIREIYNWCCLTSGRSLSQTIKQIKLLKLE